MYHRLLPREFASDSGTIIVRAKPRQDLAQAPSPRELALEETYLQPESSTGLVITSGGRVEKLDFLSPLLN